MSSIGASASGPPSSAAFDFVDVGLVVLVVMDFHRRLVDVRLKRVVGVRQRRN